MSDSVVSSLRILDVQPNRLSVGGVRSIEALLHRRGQVATHDFVGCIMEFAVNGRPLEPSQALASHGILDRSVTKHTNTKRQLCHWTTAHSALWTSVNAGWKLAPAGQVLFLWIFWSRLNSVDFISGDWCFEMNALSAECLTGAFLHIC